MKENSLSENSKNIFYSRPDCPCCGAKAADRNIIKKGVKNGRTRFLCKECGLQFYAPKYMQYIPSAEDTLKRNMGAYANFLDYFKDKDEDESAAFLINLLSGGRDENEDPDCPYCGTKAGRGRISKNGRRKDGVQKYVCKICGKNFVPSTKTALCKIRKNPEEVELFIRLMLRGETLKSCEKECGFAFQTVYDWRKKILDAFCVYLKETKEHENAI